MPWTVDNPPSSVKNKPKHVIQACVLAANSALAKGQTEEEAIFACLGAAKRTEGSNVSKAVKRTVPQHVLALIDKAIEPYVAPVASEEPSSVVSVEFDNTNHLVVTLSSGKVLRTKRAIEEGNIQQHVAVQVNPVFDYVRFNTDVPDPLHEEGLLFYDRTDHCLVYYNEDSNVKVSLSREQMVRVYNNKTYSILDGKAAYIDGAYLGWPTVGLTVSSSKTAVESTIGVCTGVIAPNDYGYICISGNVNGIDTSMYSPGTVLYISGTTAGDLTNIPLLQPNYNVEVATVLVQDATVGSLLIRVDKKQWYPSLQLVHAATAVLPTVATVFKPSTTLHNDGFTYSSVTGEITFNVSSSYSISMQINALPNASNRHLYFYFEQNNGAGWFPVTYSARMHELINNYESQVLFTDNEYYAIGTKIRLNMWAQSSVSLISTNLPGTTPGTIILPAFRMNIA